MKLLKTRSTKRIRRARRRKPWRRLASRTDFLQITTLEQSQKKSGKRDFEFLRIPAMSAGIYTLAAGATDSQSPHREAELYYVTRGRARMKAGNEDHTVAAGSVIF